MSRYRVLIDGEAVDDDFYDLLATLEVEENAELPGALRMVLPLRGENGDLTWVGDAKLRPFANIAVVVAADDGPQHCVFDGYVLSHRVHVQAGIVASTVEVWAQDASVLMSLAPRVHQWSGMTDGEVADEIFRANSIIPAARNTQDDSPAHVESGHTLMQRGSDLEFLRTLARRTGRWCRVVCDDTPGRYTGYFALPDLSGDAAVTLNLNTPAKASVGALDFHWDVARPSTVLARQGSITEKDPLGVPASTSDSGLHLLDKRGLRDFAGRDCAVRLTAAGDDSDLPVRARAVLRDAGWFTGCTGTAEMSRLKKVMRVGALVDVEGCGKLLSGRYLATGVRHSIGGDSHTMAFTLVRNAVGAAPSGGGGLAGMLGL